MDKTQELEVLFNEYLNKIYDKALAAFYDEYNKKEDFNDALDVYYETYNNLLLSEDAQSEQYAIIESAAKVGIDQAYSDLDLEFDGLTKIEPDDLAVLIGLNVDSFNTSRDKSGEELEKAYKEREQYEPTKENPIWLDAAIGGVSGYFTGKALQVAVNSVYNSERKGVTKFINGFSTANYKIKEVDRFGNETGFLLTEPNVMRVTQRDSRVRHLHSIYDRPSDPLVTTMEVFEHINYIDGFGCRCEMRLTNIKAEVVSIYSMKVQNFYEATSSDIVTRNGKKAIKLVMCPIVCDSAMKGYYYPADVVESYNKENDAKSVKIDINHDNIDVGGSTDKYINSGALIFESFVNVTDLVNSDIGLNVLQKLTSGEGFECGVSFEGEIFTREVEPDVDHYGNQYKEVVDKFTIERISILLDKDPAGNNQGTRVINSDEEAEKMSKELEAKIETLEKTNTELAIKVKNFEEKEAEQLKIKIANAAEATGLDKDFFDGMSEDKIDKIVSKVSNSKEEDKKTQDPQKTKVKNEGDPNIDDDFDFALPNRYQSIK